MTNFTLLVLKMADDALRKHWTRTSDVSIQTKASGKVCRTWQESVLDQFGSRFEREYPVGQGFREKIDLVDRTKGIAYELKVSKNNTHFEFYRDVFKVLIHNRTSPSFRIRRLYSITPHAGAEKVRTAYAKEVARFAANQGVAVEVLGIQ